jgi:hypothetical protein
MSTAVAADREEFRFGAWMAAIEAADISTDAASTAQVAALYFDFATGRGAFTLEQLGRRLKLRDSGSVAARVRAVLDAGLLVRERVGRCGRASVYRMAIPASVSSQGSGPMVGRNAANPGSGPAPSIASQGSGPMAKRVPASQGSGPVASGSNPGSRPPTYQDHPLSQAESVTYGNAKEKNQAAAVKVTTDRACVRESDSELFDQAMADVDGRIAAQIAKAERQATGDRITAKYRPQEQHSDARQGSTPAAGRRNVPDRAPSVPASPATSGPAAESEIAKSAADEFDVEKVRAEIGQAADGWLNRFSPVWQTLTIDQQVAVLGPPPPSYNEPPWIVTIRTHWHAADEMRRHRNRRTLWGPGGTTAAPEGISPTKWLLDAFIAEHRSKMPDKTIGEWGTAIHNLLGEGLDPCLVWAGLKLSLQTGARPQLLAHRVADAQAADEAKRRQLAGAM